MRMRMRLGRRSEDREGEGERKGRGYREGWGREWIG
jgi:hypothetical protein